MNRRALWMVGAMVILGMGCEAPRRRPPPQYCLEPLGVADVKTLVKAGTSDEVIISQIRNTRTIYHLSTDDILDLKNAGTSEKVIDFMINTPAMYRPMRPPPPPFYYY